MHPKMHGVLPCENDQTKLDHFSRLACSTLLSKILESAPPERCSFGSRPELLRSGVLELVALGCFAFDRFRYRFCANLLNLSNFHLLVKPNLFHRPRPLKLIVGGLFLIRESRSACWNGVLSRRVALRKISKSDRRTMRLSRLGSQELPPGSCNGLFSAGFPTGVSG